MYIKVSLLNGIKEPLSYKNPPEWGLLPLGTLVLVPLRNKKEYGYVVESTDIKPDVSFTIKEVLKIVDFPLDPFYMPFLETISHYHQTSIISILQRIKRFLSLEQDKESVLPTVTVTTEGQVVRLTSEQESVVTYVTPFIQNPSYNCTLIHGVTGCGKTEVYKKLILEAIAHNKSAIFLVPEVTLAVRFEHLFIQTLENSFDILSFHCATSAKDKKRVWQNLKNKKPMLIVGVHLPVLLPIANLGIIIVDEEHETGFQEKKHPRINSKEAAILRAQQYHIPIVLGSATPSIASIYNTQHRNWKLFSITKRFKGAFPTISTVFLSDKKQRKHFWITKELEEAIRSQLAKKEQTIIFINRRGMSFFIQCAECSYVCMCTNCSVSLTVHDHDILRCHYCNYRISQPSACPECKKTNFIKKGIGTQQVTQILQKLFPQARIGRADLDATVNKRIWQETIQKVENRTIDIVVGTQTITKGYDFPGVTLIGIIWADIDLHIPFYNAQETALQKIIQVAGRAGRHSDHSKVIIQTFGNHDILKYTTETSYLNFYAQEIEHRTELLYPPIGRFAEITLQHKNQSTVEQESIRLFNTLLHHPHLQLLGPSDPPVSKIKKLFSKKIYIKSSSFDAIIRAYHESTQEKYLSLISFTPSPLS